MIKIGNSASNISVYTCQPKSKDELHDIIKNRIGKEGNNCDLNDIDTSEIIDMSNLFNGSFFNGDISKWDVSNVKNMSCMFSFSDFSGDISKWNVSKVESMYDMFAYSKFNADISKWKLNKNCVVSYIFDNCSITEKFKPKPLQKK